MAFRFTRDNSHNDLGRLRKILGKAFVAGDPEETDEETDAPRLRVIDEPPANAFRSLLDHLGIHPAPEQPADGDGAA